MAEIDKTALLNEWYALGPHKALEDIALGVIAVFEDGHILWANRETLAIFGYPRPMLVGQHVNILVPEDRRAGHSENIARWLQNPRARQMGELLGIQGRNRNGSLMDLEIQLLPNEISLGMIVLVGIRPRKDEVLELHTRIE